MQIVLDTETNGLDEPTKIHFVVARDLNDLNKVEVFEDVHKDPRKILSYLSYCDLIVGHNLLSYDICRVLSPIVGWNPDLNFDKPRLHDTLILSKLFNYRRKGGHSIEAYAREFNLTKVGADITDWETPTPEMLDRCINDTLVTAKLFLKLQRFTEKEEYKEAIALEYYTSYVCEHLKEAGFPFDTAGAEDLLSDLVYRLDELDEELKTAFPPTRELVATITPRTTQKGTIHAVDFRRLLEAGYSAEEIEPGVEYTIWEEKHFDPNSVRQIVTRLNDAGWKPVEKTKGHVEYLKNNRRDRLHANGHGQDDKGAFFARFGWTVSEDNLRTLPASAPEAAHRLAERLILAGRVRRLQEWLNLTEASKNFYGYDVIRCNFNSIGAWTHRKSSSPNMQNVPAAKHKAGETELEKFYNDMADDMRGFWIAPVNYRLIGTDADGIQMRVLCHLTKDEKLREAIVNGDKAQKTDIHNIHMQALGAACKSRDVAKTFIYAFLLGAGVGKIAQILEVNNKAAKEAVENFINFYPGLKKLKQEQIPYEVERGFFTGLDGRPVIVQTEHEALAGHLQNGESVIMKRACREWRTKLKELGTPFVQVNDVHDEWQTLVEDEDVVAKEVARIQVESIRNQGTELNLFCPLDGESKQGYSWKETH